MVQISNFGHFKRKFEKLRHASNLFAFFLFDDRPSQQAVEKFASENIHWLDALAASAEMFFFVFLRKNLNNPGGVANPGLEVARMFDLPPNKLPGVVLFTLAKDDESVSKGLFFPLKAQLFDADISHVEEVFSDLFTILQKCNQAGQNNETLLEEIEKEIGYLANKERRRPIMLYLQDGLISLANYPRELLKSIGEAFATETARRLTGGG